MIDGPIALAFSAGLISTVNPCGFAMLPAYLSYMLGLDDEGETSRPAAVARGLAIGSVVSLGFLTVFGIAGIGLVAGLDAIVDIVPWVALVIGAMLVVLGIALLNGYVLKVRLPSVRARRGTKYGSVYAFGISYALASLSCTLPIFLTIVVGSISNASFVSGVTLFLAYAAGMAVMLLGITVALALGKNAAVRNLRRASQYVNTISGIVLVLAGAFIVFYWTLILANGDTALTENFLSRAVESLSADLQGWIGERPWIAIVLAAPIVAALFYVWLRRSPTTPAERERAEPEPLAAE